MRFSKVVTNLLTNCTTELLLIVSKLVESTFTTCRCSFSGSTLPPNVSNSSTSGSKNPIVSVIFWSRLYPAFSDAGCIWFTMTLSVSCGLLARITAIPVILLRPASLSSVISETILIV